MNMAYLRNSQHMTNSSLFSSNAHSIVELSLFCSLLQWAGSVPPAIQILTSWLQFQVSVPPCYAWITLYASKQTQIYYNHSSHINSFLIFLKCIYIKFEVLMWNFPTFPTFQDTFVLSWMNFGQVLSHPPPFDLKEPCRCCCWLLYIVFFYLIKR